MIKDNLDTQSTAGDTIEGIDVLRAERPPDSPKVWMSDIRVVMQNHAFDLYLLSLIRR